MNTYFPIFIFSLSNSSNNFLGLKVSIKATKIALVNKYESNPAV